MTSTMSSVSFPSITTTVTNRRRPPPTIRSSDRFFFAMFNTQFTVKHHYCGFRPTNLNRISATASANTHDSSNFNNTFVENQGSNENDGKNQATSSNDILKKLKKYGVSGILSYGLLNTAYYLTTFLVVWFYVAPVPGKMGYLAAVQRFLKVMAMVWAGSQVTKIARAGGALALAPFVAKGLSWFTLKFGFKSQGKAFMAIVGVCFGLAFLLFLIVTLLWS